MAWKWRELATLFLRHCHRAIICYISATATCATFFSSHQCRSGAKSGASAQHWCCVSVVGGGKGMGHRLLMYK